MFVDTIKLKGNAKEAREIATKFKWFFFVKPNTIVNLLSWIKTIDLKSAK